MSTPRPGVAGADTDAAEAAALSAPLDDDQVAGRVVRGGAARLAGYLTSNLVAAGAAILVLRALEVERYGQYATVMAILAIMQIVTDAGLTVTGTQQLALQRTSRERNHLQSQILTMRVLLSTAGLLVAVGLTYAIYGSELGRGAAIAGAGVVLYSVQSAIVLPLTVEMRNGLLSLNEVLRNVALLAGFVVVAALGADLIWFFAVQFFAGVCMILASPLLVGLRRALVPPSADLRGMWTLVRIALPIAFGAVISIVYTKVVLIVVSLMETEFTTGVYAAASRIFEIVGTLPAVVGGVVLPVLTLAARDNRERMLYILRRSTEAMALAGLLLSAVIFVAADPIVEIIGGSGFSDAASALRIQCLALASLFVGNALAVGVLAIQRALQGAFASLAGVLVAAGAAAALVPELGADGGAVAMVIADAVLVAALWFVLRRGRGTPDVSLRFASAAVAVAVVAAGAGLLLPGPELVAGAVTAVVFAGLAHLLGIIPSELRDELRRPAGAR